MASTTIAHMDSSQWPSLGEWDPEIKHLFETTPRPKFDFSDPLWRDPVKVIPAREMVNTRARSGILAKMDLDGVEQSTIKIPFRDGTSLPSLLFKPTKPPAAGSPLVVLFHGGGFVVGIPEMEMQSAVPLVKDFGATVISAAYRQAPEHVFPTAIYDCWDSVKWCAANAATLGADPSKGFLIGGSSAGGLISAVLQHLARDEKLEPPLTGTYLAYAPVVSKESVPEKFKHEFTSEDRNYDAPIMGTQVVYDTFEIYKADHKSELNAPLNWSSGHAGLARTHLQVTGMDPTRDAALLYERELRLQGVETSINVYPGCSHGVENFFPDSQHARQFEEDRVKAWRWLLQRE